MTDRNKIIGLANDLGGDGEDIIMELLVRAEKAEAERDEAEEYASKANAALMETIARVNKAEAALTETNERIYRLETALTRRKEQGQ